MRDRVAVRANDRDSAELPSPGPVHRHDPHPWVLDVSRVAIDYYDGGGDARVGQHRREIRGTGEVIVPRT